MTDDLFTFAKQTAYPDGVPADVCALFEKLALDVRDRGWTRYSADALLHRIRWEMQIERGQRGFKINNNWSALLARWFLKKYPGMEKFFELRERISQANDCEAA